MATTAPTLQLANSTPELYLEVTPEGLASHLGWQCFSYEPISGRVLMAQAIKGSKKNSEHTLIHTYEPKTSTWPRPLTLVSTDKLYDAGHPTTIGVTSLGGDKVNVHVPWDKIDSTGKRTNAQLATVTLGGPMKPVKTRTVAMNSSSVKIRKTGTTRYQLVSINQGFACIRTVDKNGHDWFLLRTLANYLADKAVNEKVIGPFTETQTFQGFEINGNQQLFIVTGGTEDSIRVWQYDWKDAPKKEATKIQRIAGMRVWQKSESFGKLPGDPTTRTYREPEGLLVIPGVGLCMGVKMYGAARKRFRLFVITPWPKPVAKTYTVKPGDTLIRIGDALQLDWRKIAEKNKLAPPYPLAVGQKLLLP